MKFKSRRLYEPDSFGVDRFVAIEMEWSDIEDGKGTYIRNRITKRELDTVKVFRFKYLLMRARELKKIFNKSKF